LAITTDRFASPRGLIAWRVVVWLLLLFSAFGCLLYVHHAQQVWQQLQAVAPPDVQDITALHGMLGWDVAYLLAAFALIVICAGCIMRQAWARPWIRVAAPLLALWLISSGFLQLQDLREIDANGAALLSQVQAQGVAAVEQTVARLHRSYQLALLLKGIAVPLLLWLSWMLGQPKVRAQFRSRR
jgi:hypothetical protein